MNESRSYVDDLARAHVQLGLQRALEAERDEIVGRSWHDHYDQGVSLPSMGNLLDRWAFEPRYGIIEIGTGKLTKIA